MARRRKTLGLCGLGAVLTVLALWALAFGGCRPDARPADPRRPESARAHPARPVAPIDPDQLLIRVRLINQPDAVVAVAGAYQITAGGRCLLDSPQPMPETPLAVAPDGRIRIGQTLYDAASVEIVPRSSGTLRVNQRGYHGRLRLGRDGANLVGVNVVHIEDYIAGVVTSEMPSRFGVEPLKAQAVAARTYVLFEKYLHRDWLWDVTDDTNSQVYLGVESDRGVGRQVTDATRGIVLTFGPPGQERIFPAFYHSTCGRQSVSVRWIKPNIREIPPLAGGVRCDWCAQSPWRNWKTQTVTLAKRDFWTKLRRVDPAIPADWRGVQLAEGRKDSAGRLLTVQVIAPGARPVTILADSLRMAVGPRAMLSTLCGLADSGEAIELSDGHGWGHGMGLCQYGAGGQGAAGRDAMQILKFYYPNAVLKRAY